MKKAIALAPASAELRAELAALYARQDRAREALETAEAALQRDPANREANRILGSVYAALSEQRQAVPSGRRSGAVPGRAIAALEKSRRDAGLDLNLELMLGRLYLQAGDYDKAIAQPAARRRRSARLSRRRDAACAAQEGAGQTDDAIGRSRPRSRTTRSSSAATSGWPSCTSSSAASRTRPTRTPARRPRTPVRT